MGCAKSYGRDFRFVDDRGENALFACFLSVMFLQRSRISTICEASKELQEKTRRGGKTYCNSGTDPESSQALL